MSRPTRTLVGAKARKAVLDGVNAIYIPTSKTFGPEGRNALLYRTFNRGSRITNDGVTVAEVQEPKDIFTRLSATAFKEGCKRTNERVGDGTTATAIIGGKLFNDCYNLLNEGQSSYNQGGQKMGVMTLKKNILSSATKVKQAIEASAKKVETLEELEKIAIVSVEDEDLGKLIAGMAWKVGVDGFIDVVEGYKGEIETEIIEGGRFPAKVAAKGFVNNPARYEMIAKEVAVVLTNYKLLNMMEVSNFLNPILKENKKVAILSPDFSEQVLNDMWNGCFKPTNEGIVKSGLELYPIKVPSLQTEQFEDLAVYFGAKFIDKQKGMRLTPLKQEDLGFAEKIIVKDSEAKEDAMAIGGGGTRDEVVIDITEQEIEKKVGDKIVKKKEKIQNERKTTKTLERIAVLKSQIDETPQEQFKLLLKRRIASLSSSVGVIRVGDSTQASSLYRKLKIEDAVYACKAALRGGYVRGGGICLKDIADKMSDSDVLKKCLLAPYEQIQNSVDGGMVIGDEIIDPMEAIYYAVEHATQVVANLITVDIITQEWEDPIHGEGELEIARALREFVINDKINKGQLRENEREMERDRMDQWLAGESLESDELIQLSGHDYES